MKKSEIEKMKKDRRENTDYVLNILGNKVYVTKNCPTIMRYGHTTKELEASYRILLFDKKVQELMVLVTLGIYKHRKNTENQYTLADKQALQKMVAKYPKVKKKFWHLAFLLTFDIAANTGLNRRRLNSISLEIAKTIKKKNSPRSK